MQDDYSENTEMIGAELFNFLKPVKPIYVK